jgi:hypothetical protein
VSVAAQIPKERTAGKDEKPDQKAKLDKEFKDKEQKLEDKLAQEQGYGKWIYLVSSWTVDSLMKQRHELLAEKKVEAKKEEKTASAADPAKKDDATIPFTTPTSDTGK